jgi:Flp pilus assembly protein TadB
LSPRYKLLLALPVVAAFVIVLAYYQLFTNTVVVVVIFVLWVAVTLRNRRKFSRQEPKG